MPHAYYSRPPHLYCPPIFRQHLGQITISIFFWMFFLDFHHFSCLFPGFAWFCLGILHQHVWFWFSLARDVPWRPEYVYV